MNVTSSTDPWSLLAVSLWAGFATAPTALCTKHLELCATATSPAILASTSVVTTQGGGIVAQQIYKPWGEPRWINGTLPTDHKFTGQRSEEATLGSLYDYNARFYSPALGRFLSPDTIVPSPGNPQSLNRYAYVLNNPLRYTDPSGMRIHGKMTDMGNWLLGATILIPGGLLLLVWSAKVWRSPGYIRSVGFMYKYFMRWLPDNTEPTETQIKLYAAFGILMGTNVLLIGLLVISGFVTT